MFKASLLYPFPYYKAYTQKGIFMFSEMDKVLGHFKYWYQFELAMIVKKRCWALLMSGNALVRKMPGT